MGVTNEYSTEYKKYTDPATNGYFAANGLLVPLIIQPFNFTQGAAAGDATSTMTLFKIPPGRFRFLPQLSWIQWALFGSSRTLDIGHGAYVGEDGVTVNASLARFDDDIDVSSAGKAFMGSDLAIADAAGVEFISRRASLGATDALTGVNIVATVAGGTIPIGTVLRGALAFAGVGLA